MENFCPILAMHSKVAHYLSFCIVEKCIYAFSRSSCSDNNNISFCHFLSCKWHRDKSDIFILFFVRYQMIWLLQLRKNEWNIELRYLIFFFNFLCMRLFIILSTIHCNFICLIIIYFSFHSISAIAVCDYLFNYVSSNN